MTGPTLTKVNTFRSMPEEREQWDRVYRELGFESFTAFVRTRLNGAERSTSAVEKGRTPPPATFPPEGEEAASAPHHPRCTCTVCTAKRG